MRTFYARIDRDDWGHLQHMNHFDALATIRQHESTDPSAFLVHVTDRRCEADFSFLILIPDLANVRVADTSEGLALP